MKEPIMLSCGYCGHEAKINKIPLNGTDMYAVSCSNLDCDVFPSTTFSENLEEVLDKWNNRNYYSELGTIFAKELEKEGMSDDDIQLTLVILSRAIANCTGEKESDDE